DLREALQLVVAAVVPEDRRVVGGDAAAALDRRGDVAQARLRVGRMGGFHALKNGDGQGGGATTGAPLKEGPALGSFLPRPSSTYTPFMHLGIRGAFVALAAALVGACGGDSPTQQPPSAGPAALAAVTGDGQTGIAAAPLGDSLAVRVVDAGGRGISGVQV